MLQERDYNNDTILQVADREEDIYDGEDPQNKNEAKEYRAARLSPERISAPAPTTS